MSDTSMGPGWWLASDGKWYPPQLHPGGAPEQPVPQWVAPRAGHEPGEAPAGSTGPVENMRAAARRRRQVTVALVLAIVVVLGALGAVVAVTFGSGPGTAGTEVIDRAVASALSERTAQITMTSTETVGGKGVVVSGAGSVDFSDNALEIALGGTVAGQALHLEVVYLGGVIYEQLPEIGQLAPGKSWLSIDLSSLGQAAGQGSIGGLGGNPLALLHALAQQGNTVTALGTSAVDGQMARGYAVTLDPATIQREMDKADLPAWMRQAVSEVTVSGGSEQLYVSDAGTLVRESTAMTEKLASEGTISVDQVFDFSDYGTAVSISAPPPSQVLSFSQFLQLSGGSSAQ